MPKIKKYSLIKLQDYTDFKKEQPAFLSLLKNSYGEAKYFGDDIYNQKIEEKDLVILLAVEDNIIVGTVIMKSYGKLSGLAVTENYRRKGLAKELIEKLQNERSYLYGEVTTINLEMQNLLTKIGFTVVKDKAKIMHLLTREKDEVLFVKDTPQILSYIHSKDKKDIDRKKEFLMFEFVRE